MDSKKLHILFLSSWYPSSRFPARGDFIERHAKAAAENNVDVTNIHIVSTPKRRKGFNIQKSIHDKLESYVVYVKMHRNPLRKFFIFFKAFKAVYKDLKKVDGVHVHVTYPAGLLALYLKRKYNLKYIITEHWTGYHKPMNEGISKLTKWLSKKITSNASVICPVSEQLGESMRQFGLKGHYQSIPNIVDTKLFKPASSSVGIKNGPIKLLHVSNMKDEHKNISGILRVVKSLMDAGEAVELTLVGGNPLFTDRLMKKTAMTGKAIVIPEVTQKELIPYFQAADVFVMFSNYENLPCVILEAFSAGLPVISTQVGGIDEYFPSGFGILIPPKDEAALAAAILEFKNNFKRKSKQDMHQYAVDNFSKSAVVNRYLALYARHF